jgi:hypothetical protein
MFEDAVSYRSIIHEHQRNAPLTFEEISYTVRGRYAWDTERKEWTVSYRKFRDYWILLLLTVNERIFSL